MVAIGFTGTRAGMTTQQKNALRIHLEKFFGNMATDFRHGDAIGADTEAAEIAILIGYREVKFPAGDNPLARNRTIVDGSQFMLATPKEFQEILRSGTWATIRYTNKNGVLGLIIWPDGRSVPMRSIR